MADINNNKPTNSTSTNMANTSNNTNVTNTSAANMNSDTIANNINNTNNTNANAAVSANAQASVPGKVPESHQEPGLDYTVNHGLDANLQPSTKATANYLIHRMLWDQQDKVDNDDVAVSKQGTMEVQDEFGVQPRE